MMLLFRELSKMLMSFGMIAIWIQTRLKFLTTRIRHKKKMPGEVAYDDLIEDPEHKFHVEVIYATVDSMVNELCQRTMGFVK